MTSLRCKHGLSHNMTQAVSLNQNMKWPRGLRRESAAARLLGLRVRIPPGVRFLTRTDTIPPPPPPTSDKIWCLTSLKSDWYHGSFSETFHGLKLQLSTHHNIQPILRMYEAAPLLIYASSNCRALTLLPQKTSPYRQERKKRNTEPRIVLIYTNSMSN